MHHILFSTVFSKKSGHTLFMALVVAFGFGFIQSAAVAQSASSVLVSTAKNAVDPVIVTATRNKQDANDVLADFVYIGPEEISEAGQTSITGLLQRQRGVEVSSNGGGGSISSVFLRGANSAQTLVLIDGIRSQSTLSGAPSWQAIPLSIVDHIEIVFGPQSSLYGSDAIGGVVQIFTKTGDGPMQVGASAGYGGYGTSIVEASIYGSTGDEQKTRYALSATQELSTGFNTIAPNNPYIKYYNTTQKMGYVRDGMTGKLSQEWAKGQELGFQMFASRNNSQYPVYDPSKVVGNQINDVSTYALYSKNHINSIWNSLVQVSQSYDLGQAIYNTGNPYASGNPVTNSKQNIYTWQNDINVGPDLFQLVAERKTATVNATSGSLNQEQDTNSVGASYQLKRGSNLANVSLRNDSITGYGPQTTGGVSYGYFFTKEWRANINYGTGFKAPSFLDLYYPNYGVSTLKPEKSKNTEAGIHYETKLYDINLVAYNNSITNLIQYTSGGCPAGYHGCASNVASAKILGVSLGGVTRLGGYTLKGSFDQENPIDQSTGYVLARRARQFGNAGVEYKVKALTVGAEGTFQANRYDNSNTGNMGGYGIFNTYANYEASKDWSVFARWNNMLNKNYQLSYGYMTPGSNVFVGLRYAMK